MAKISSTPASLSQIKPAALAKFHAKLADWYAAHGRHDLPWRNTADPYHIWISEVMLQQTQVATVRDRFYFPFLARFPTVEALAAAPREAVMKAWEGLGYYRRAGHLHDAAKQLIIEGGLAQWSREPCVGSAEPQSGRGKPRSGEGGASPPSVNYLLSLSGIGRNTAHAILAFGYHQPVAIMEANVKRIVARVFALTTPTDGQLWQGAEMLLNRTQPFDYNQAMMDVGSMICTPKAPRCDACPAAQLCQGKSSPEEYPTPKAKKHIPTREVTIYMREDARGRLFLEKRDAALLGGLYGFPQVSHQSPVASRQLSAKIDAPECQPPLAGDWRLVTGDSLGTITHIYSHFKLIGHVVHQQGVGIPNSGDWYSAEEIATLPLSTLDHKVLSLVENCHRAKKKPRKARAVHQAH